jgi:hypothetical protein
MKRGMLVSLVILVLLSAIPTIFASSTESKLIDLKELKSRELRELATLWDNMLGSYDDAGYHAKQILKKDDKNKLENIVRDLLMDKYIDQISVKEYEFTTKNTIELAEKQVKSCAWFIYTAKESQVTLFQQKLTIAITETLRSNKKLKMYSGNIIGDFDLYYRYTSFVDWENDQLMTIFCGYSE